MSTKMKTYSVAMAIDEDQISVEDLHDRMQVGLNTLGKHAPTILGVTDEDSCIVLKITPTILYHYLSQDYRTQLTMTDLNQICDKVRDKYKPEFVKLRQLITNDLNDVVKDTFPDRKFINGDSEGVYYGTVMKHCSSDNDKNMISAQRHFIDELLIKQLISNVRNNTKQNEQFDNIDDLSLAEDLFYALSSTFRQYGIFIWDPDSIEDTEVEDQD